MVAVATQSKIDKMMTLGEFETLDAQLRYELIEGVPVKMSPLNEAHGGLGSSIAYALTHKVRDERLGRCFLAETRFVINLNSGCALAPDWVFIRADPMPLSLSKKFSRIVPDVVLKIRSPSDRASNVESKMRMWIDAGV